MLTDKEIEENIVIFSVEKKNIDKSISKFKRELTIAENNFIKKFCTEEFNDLREKIILFFYRRCDGKNTLSLSNFEINASYFSKSHFNIYNRKNYDCISTNMNSSMKSIWKYRDHTCFIDEYIKYSKILKSIESQERTKPRTTSYSVSDFYKICIKYKIDPSYENYKYVCKDYLEKEEFDLRIQDLLDEQKVKNAIKLLAKRHK